MYLAYASFNYAHRDTHNKVLTDNVKLFFFLAIKSPVTEKVINLRRIDWAFVCLGTIKLLRSQSTFASDKSC